MKNNTSQRIAGRIYAEELVDLSEIKDKSLEFKKGFWRELYYQAKKNVSTPKAVLKIKLMTDEDAKVFERKRIGFGKHKDTPFRDVPIDYLVWLSEQGSEIAAYVRSERGQKAQSDLIENDT